MDLDAMLDEIRRLRRFAADHSKTCYSCESCGHARTTRECLWCENKRLREAAQSVVDSMYDHDCHLCVCMDAMTELEQALESKGGAT